MENTKSEIEVVTASSLAHPDVAEIAELVFASFKDLRDRSNLPDEFPTLESALRCIEEILTDPNSCFVAIDRAGGGDKIVGFNAVDYTNFQQSEGHGAWEGVVAVGPVAVLPSCQGKRVGKRLMMAAIAQARSRGASSIRITADAHNPAAVAMYASLGFETKMTLAVVQQAAAVILNKSADGTVEDGHVRIAVEPMRKDDVEACVRIGTGAFGFSRRTELLASIDDHDGQLPLVLWAEDGQEEKTTRREIVGYTTGLHYAGHTLVNSGQDFRSLLHWLTERDYAESGGDGMPLFLLDMEHHSRLLTWCFVLRKTMLLMALGDYHAPDPKHWIYFPSVVY